MDSSTPNLSRLKTCYKCEEKFPLHKVKRCPVCRKLYCRKCGVVDGGRRFCSKGCGRFHTYHTEEE